MGNLVKVTGYSYIETMSIKIELQIAKPTITNSPTPKQFTSWVGMVLPQNKPVTITIRIVDDIEITALNHQYRNKSSPTNILSFPLQVPPGVTTKLLGDLVICAPLVAIEARRLDIPELSHWAHLTMHGTLHLLGYDHTTPKQASIMEPLEIAALAKLNIPNPYTETL